MDILWLFFMLSALQPIIKQKLLEASRKRLIALIERDRKSRLVLLVHRQETMSLLGFPLFRYIDINDSEDILRAIHMTDPEIPLDLVLHTPGGLVLAATQIARAIFKHKGKVTVFVPHYAMSGGTLLALAADEIVMCEHAVLGPVDPQFGEYPSEKAKEMAKLMTSGTWTHDYPITFERARDLELRVNSNMPENMMRLMQLYPQPVRRQPSVEYVPIPYRSNRRAAPER